MRSYSTITTRTGVGLFAEWDGADSFLRDSGMTDIVPSEDGRTQLAADEQSVKDALHAPHHRSCYGQAYVASQPCGDDTIIHTAETRCVAECSKWEGAPDVPIGH